MLGGRCGCLQGSDTDRRRHPGGRKLNYRPFAIIGRKIADHRNQDDDPEMGPEATLRLPVCKIWMRRRHPGGRKSNYQPSAMLGRKNADHRNHNNEVEMGLEATVRLAICKIWMRRRHPGGRESNYQPSTMLGRKTRIKEIRMMN
jgi:hypothetical protein